MSGWLRSDENGAPAEPACPRRFDDIWRFIALESGSETIADRQIDTLTDRFYLLADWPRIGRMRNNLRRGLRSHPVGNYLIFYRIVAGDVLILRVLHGRRDIRATLRVR